MGKYELVRPLATGGMAEVFLAKADGPMGFAKTVVVKRIRPHLLEDPTFVEMFLGEATLAAQLNHPNIVQIFDFGEADGTYYIAMEYVDGPNLRTLEARAVAANQPLPLAIVAKIVSYACEGLAYAHDFVSPETGQPLNIVHRDISPDNIVVAQSGAVKVVDFGIAKAAQQSHQTRTGLRKGKLAYMSPEYLRGKQPDRRADVFALGVVLYELVSGKKPYDAESEIHLMHAMIYEDMVPVRARRPDLPDAMEAIVERALKREPDERYPSCRELQADLERFVISQGEPLSANHVAKLVASLPMTAAENAAAARTPSKPRTPAFAATPAGQKTPAKRDSGERLQMTPAKVAAVTTPAKVEEAKEESSDASTMHLTAEELEKQIAALGIAVGGGAAPAPEKSDSTMLLNESQIPLKKNIGRRLEPSVVVSQEASPSDAPKPRPSRAASGERKAPAPARVDTERASPAPPRPSRHEPTVPIRRSGSSPSNLTVGLVLAVAALMLIVAAVAVVRRVRGSSSESEAPPPPPVEHAQQEPTPAEPPPPAAPAPAPEPAAATPPEAPAPAKPKIVVGVVTISSNFPKALVSVKGKKGPAPFKAVLKPGTYPVDLLDPATGYVIKRADVEFVANTAKDFPIDVRKGKLQITDPIGAQVYVDAEPQPKMKVPGMLELWEGKHVLRFSKPPQESQLPVQVEAGKLQLVAGKLK